MAIIKESTFPSLGPAGEPLVRLLDTLPSGHGFEKTAGIHPEILAYKQQLEPEPGKTYVHILALGAGDYYGANLNNDHFPWQGLQHDHTKTAHPHMHGYKTFLNAHAFAHHMNKDPEKAYGDVLVSVLNTKMKRVELIVAIDEEKCIRNGGQRTLEKIKAGEYPSTSMGCRVPFDVCSICGHKAKYRSEYCQHTRENMGKIMADGRKVFVYNPYPRFFDISFVFIGADRTSFVLEKVANLQALNAVGSAIGSGAAKAATDGNILGQIGKAVGAVNKSPLAGTLAGATVGGIAGAARAEDGERVGGLFRGAAIGALGGGLVTHGGAALINKGAKVINKGGVGTPGLAASAGIGLTAAMMDPNAPKAPSQEQAGFMPAQTSSLQKVAADGGLGKSLRKASGTVQPFAGMRVKKKVARQSRLNVRPLTFGKLRTSAKKADAQRALALAYDPLPQLTLGTPGGFMNTRVRPAAKDDVVKSAQLKSATVTKLSDIFKDVTSAPMGRAVPMSVGAEPDIDCGNLDRIAKYPDLGQALGGIGSAGIVLKPHEFQRVVLVRSGQHQLADQLGSQGVVFPEHAPVTRSIRITISPRPDEMIPQGIMDMIGHVLSRRSALTPLALRRPASAPEPIIIRRVSLGQMPMLDKIASMYNGYREDLLLHTEDMVKSAMLTPALMGSIHEARGFNDGSGPAFEAMAELPLAYFSHAYWNRCCCDRTLNDREFAEKFTEENPQIAQYIARRVATSCSMS
jgi:hypothetical protein